MADLDIAGYLRPGDTVLIGQAAAEPPVLVERFIAAARDIGGLTAFCGYTLSAAWEGVSAGQPHIKAHVAHGPLRKLSVKGLVAAGTCGCDPAWSATGWSTSTRPGPWPACPGAA